MSLPAFLAFLLRTTTVKAGEGRLTYLSVMKFTAGMASSVLIHEASHAWVAGMTGTSLSWEMGTYNQPIGFTDHAGSGAKGVAVYSAGLVSQAIGSEIVLRSDGIDKNDAYVRGMMVWNIVNPILYSLDYWFFHISNRKEGTSYQGDFRGIEHYSNEQTANALALSLTAVVIYQGYRFLKTQAWAPDWIKGDSPRVGLNSLSSGGLAISCKFQF